MSSGHQSLLRHPPPLPPFPQVANPCLWHIEAYVGEGLRVHDCEHAEALCELTEVFCELTQGFCELTSRFCELTEGFYVLTPVHVHQGV